MPAPIIDRLSPTIGWPGGTSPSGTPINGTLVIIHGRHFHPTAEMNRNRVRFTASTGGTVPAPVEWASINEIDYQPNGVVVSDATAPNGLDGPRGIAVNSANGDLYIADTENDRILRRTSSGTLITWGTSGSGNSEFNRPTGVAVDASGHVYVADTMNHRIQKFTSSGSFVTAWGTHGSGIGEFDAPTDVDVMQIGSQVFVYVADSNNHRVARSDGTGGMATQLLAPADAGRILGVCARAYGFVYATDPARRRIYKWAWHGPFNGYYGDPGPHNLAEVDVGFPMGIEQDFDGYVYISDNAGRKVRKYDPFDPTFREIASFGLTVPSVPGPTPAEEFVDPVDVAVSDLKVAYVVDRARKQLVRYTPTDSQELWVHVPAGAASGNLEVATDDGTDTHHFNVYVMAQLDLVDAHMNQGLVEYPPVAGKRTVIRYRFRTSGATTLDNYSWGSPVHDSAVCRVLKNGTEVHRIDGEVAFLTMTGGFMSFENAFEIGFEIPPWVISDEDTYRFNVTLTRTGPVPFSDTRDFPSAAGEVFRHREHYRILASPVSHLRHDGTRVGSGSMTPALFYLGSDIGHMIDWLDYSQLYAGYAHYNRIFPVRHSFGDIADWGIWINGTMHNGINSDDEVRGMLEVLEYTRRDVNEGGGPNYDYMLGIVDRREVVGGQDWNGVTSDAWRSALISVGDNLSGNPAHDVGAIIAHELLHQHGLHHQSTDEYCNTSQDAWNSVTRQFVPDPVTLRYTPPTGTGRTSAFNDQNAFTDCTSAGVPGTYDQLYDALANPHPVKIHVREVQLKGDERPSKATQNFTLIGHYNRTSGFERTTSWIGRADTPITPELADGEGALQFLDASRNQLLSWQIRLSFGLRTMRRAGGASNIDSDTATVSVTCPYPDATAYVVLILNDQPVWEAVVPTDGPTVKLLSPSGGEQISPNDTLLVEWSAKHPEALPLEYRVSFSTDDGKTFRPLAVGCQDTSYSWQAGLAARNGRVRLRVVASDGFNQAEDVSEDILVDDVARRVAIVQPGYGEVLPEGKPLIMMAIANDLETGSIELTASNTRWRLDNEIILGQGNEVEIREIDLATPRGSLTTPLPVGEHTLSVEVRSDSGDTIRHEIPIEIAADSDRDGVPDHVEVARGEDPSDPGNRSSVAPLYPFGQWQFDHDREYTLFQIAHLLTGTVALELRFIDEAGELLSNHSVILDNGATKKTIKTNSDGWASMEIGPLESIQITIGSGGRFKRAFGVCYLRVARGSPLTETVIAAHGWISKRRGWWVFSRESEGTVVINLGKPMKIRGAKAWRGSSPLMAVPTLSHRLLGRMTMASNRLQILEKSQATKE